MNFVTHEVAPTRPRLPADTPVLENFEILKIYFKLFFGYASIQHGIFGQPNNIILKIIWIFNIKHNLVHVYSLLANLEYMLITNPALVEHVKPDYAT